MISNERRWPSRNQPQRRPYHQYQHPAQKPMHPSVPENTLATRELQIERKHFVLMVKENARGRFVRIAEDTGGRVNSIIVPVAGLKEFQRLLEEMVKADGQIPARDDSQAPPA